MFVSQIVAPNPDPSIRSSRFSFVSCCLKDEHIRVKNQWMA